jgi:hypothetical protein
VKCRNIILGTCLALLTGFVAQPASAQNGELWRERQAQRQAQRQAAQQQRRENGGRQPGERGLVGLPPKWVENLRDMSPEDRDHFMQNNQAFQNLPPERKRQVIGNLQKWDAMPPEQKERIRATERMLEQATPEQREHFQNDIVPRLEQMPPPRRQRVIGHWRRLQAMSPEEQQAALHDPAFLGNLSPDEQSIVRDLNSMGNPPPQ